MKWPSLSGGPVVEVCAVAKRDLKAGEILDDYGMYMTYGEAVNADEMCRGRYLPEGLVEGCKLMRDVRKDAGDHVRKRRASARPARRHTAGRTIPAFPGRQLAGGSSENPRLTPIMKVVLFCGGLGCAMREYSEALPKPMVPIGYRPILWHVMKYYAHYGHKDFILCLGYKADAIKKYFLKYNECVSNDFVLSKGGKNVELLRQRHPRLEHHVRRHRAHGEHRAEAEGRPEALEGRGDVPGKLHRRPFGCASSGRDRCVQTQRQHRLFRRGETAGQLSSHQCGFEAGSSGASSTSASPERG